MKRSIKAVCIAVCILLTTALSMFGCVKPSPPIVKTNYPFATEGLTEQSLNTNQHINIISAAIGEFIEDLMMQSSGLLDYDVSEIVDVSGVKFTLSVHIFFDRNATDESGDNHSLEFGVSIQNGDGALISLGIEYGMFYAEKPDGKGGVERFEMESGLLNELFRFPTGTSDSFVKELSQILLYVTFVSDSTRYGVKMESGAEISELTLSLNFFSTISSLTRAIRYLEIDSINTKYPINTANAQLNEQNKAKRAEETARLDRNLNSMTQFLFEKNYDKIYEITTVYLNLNLIMKNKLAMQIGMSVSKDPKFSKTVYNVS